MQESRRPSAHRHNRICFFVNFKTAKAEEGKRILEAFIRVCGSSRADDVSRCRFTHAAIQKTCNGGLVEDIASVDECLGLMVRESLEA